MLNVPNDFSEIDFQNDAEIEHLRDALIGETFHKFLNSDIGKYLHERAKNHRIEAVEAMAQLDIDTKRGRRLHRKYQQQMEVAECFLKWCADALADGQNAEQMLTVVHENN